MARQFFYVCGGVLMLALAWHFGATSVVMAQAANNPAVSIGSDGIVLTAGGDVYRYDNGRYTLYSNILQHAGVTLDPGDSFVAIGASTAITAYGEEFSGQGGLSQWIHRGNIFGSTTSATRTSLGALKGRYR